MDRIKRFSSAFLFVLVVLALVGFQQTVTRRDVTAATTVLQTSGTNAAVSRTLTAVNQARGYVHHIEARCSAGTANLLISSNSVNLWTTSAVEVVVTNYVRDFSTPIGGTFGQDLVVTLSTCGVGNTGTLITQTSQY